MTQAAGGLLAQTRVTGTSAVTGFTAVMRTEITKIVICNTTAGALGASVYHDDDGTTYDETTALLFAKSIAANDYLILEGGLTGFEMLAGGTIGLKTSASLGLTFSIYGTTQALGAP